jgi:hypothetical protein
MEFHEEFQKLHEKALIDHHMASWDHLKVYKLIEQMVQIVKWGTLQKYGYQKGHTKNWELELSWLGIGYRFSWQAFLASFSPYILLFGHEFKLLVSINAMLW